MGLPADMSPKQLASAVGGALTSLSEVRQAYVFGSRVSGEATAGSDLDVAVRLDPGLDDDGRAEAKLRVIAALTDALGALGERADVVDLDHASSAVAFRVIRDGRNALSRDERERVRLEAYVARRYDDEAPRRALLRSGARAAAERMGGG